MSKNSTSEIAILGVLALEDGLSGYDIRQFIDASISHFWNESYGQIYPVLARLTRQKLVKAVADKGSTRQRKKYSITPAGRQRLSQWLAEPSQPEKPRSELLLKIFLGSQTTPEIIIRHLESMAVTWKAQAAAFETLEVEIRRQDSGQKTLPFSVATIRAGVRLAQARARWAKEAIEIIQKGERD